MAFTDICPEGVRAGDSLAHPNRIRSADFWRFQEQNILTRVQFGYVQGRFRR